jgi:p-cumate 2,3-dioxygenase alpha subunit
VRWNDISRGMNREPQTVDELQMRVFWRRWVQMMGRRAAIPA